MEVKYIGEGMLDDEFVVNTWQDKEIPFTIHFVVTKQGKVSFVGRFSYCNYNVVTKQGKVSFVGRFSYCNYNVKQPKL